MREVILKFDNAECFQKHIQIAQDVLNSKEMVLQFILPLSSMNYDTVTKQITLIVDTAEEWVFEEEDDED